MTWPTITIDTTNLDEGNDSPALARPDIKQMADNVNAIKDEFNDGDGAKLANIEANANDYTHPSTDGNLHVPATSTTNDGKVLTAGSTAGSLTWETPVMDVVGKTCVFRITGELDQDAPTEHGELASPWRKNILDLADPSSYYSLSGYQLTLDAGSYELVDFTTLFAHDHGSHIIAYNATAGSVITTSSYHEIGTTNTGVESFGKLFTLTVQSAIEFRGEENYSIPYNAWLKITRVY